MKQVKIFAALCVICLLVGSQSASALTVNNPSTLENWSKGQTYTIRWDNSTGCPVTIRLFKGNSPSYYSMIKDSYEKSNGSSYPWTVPSYLPADDDYRIKVLTICGNSGNQFGYSGYFQISDGAPVISYGSVSATIYPNTAVSAGALWCADGGSWKSSGATLSSLSVGNHTVSFKPISGWNTPPNQTVYVSANSTANTSGTYTQQAQYASVQVNLSPSGAVSAGAQWQVNGAWQSSGNSVNLSAGTYTITFRQINGWITPDPMTVIIAGTGVQKYSKDYTPQSTPSNSPPTYTSGNASSTGCIGGKITFECVWTAPPGHNIEGVKARYRKIGTTGWSDDILLGFVNGSSPPKFSGSASISSEGEYEFQFQATDVSTNPPSTSEWMLGNGSITVQGECPPNTCVTYPLADVDPTTDKIVRKVVPGFSFGAKVDQINDDGTCNNACVEGYHPGTDFYFFDSRLSQSKANFGKEVRSIAANGTVKKISYPEGLGTLVEIEYEGNFIIPGEIDSVNTISAVYLHLGEVSVKEGDSVDMNTPIGKIGNLNHLHLEIRLSTAIPSPSRTLVYCNKTSGDNTCWNYNQVLNKEGVLKNLPSYYKNLDGMIGAGLRDPEAFIKANYCTPPTTVAKSSGIIAPSQTVKKTVAMTKSSKGSNKFSLQYPKLTYARSKGLRESPSELDLIITTPSGNVLTPQSSEVKEYVSETNQKSYTIDVQEEGEWIAEIVAVRVPPEGESYSFEVINLDGVIDPAIDTDNDGIPDIWEFENGLNPLENDASEDSDNDGISNLDEYKNSITAPTEFTAGLFTVDETGKVKIDWLYDGGAYRGEFGIFSLAGMENLVPNSPEFIAEAIKRVLSCSTEGYTVFSDLTEGARFSGQLGSSNEPDRNAGKYNGMKSFAMTPGDRFAAILVPNSTFAELAKNPSTTDSGKRPIFSLASSNADHKLYFGQFAKIVDKETGEAAENAFAFEDMAFANSDSDYNDLIIQFRGVTVTAPTLDNPELGFKKDWRVGENPVLPHIQVSPPSPDTLWITITLKSPADLLVYDPHGRVIGKEGGYIPGATFEFDGEGHQTVTLPVLESGDYRAVLQGKDNGGLCHLEVRGFMGDTEISSEEVPFEILPHQTLKTVISATDFMENQSISFEKPDVSKSADGKIFLYDFDGDGDIDIADIMKLASIWDSCKGDEDYDAFYDLDDSGCIRLNDIMKVVNSSESR